MSPQPIPADTIVRAACPHDCPDTCALHVTVRDGRAISVVGDPTHPTTDGVLCAKVSRYPERTYSPDRVLTPLRRVGRKGEGKFEPATWDEALDDIAARLKAIAARDPQRILPYSYAGTMGWVQGEGMASRFFHRLGASMLERTICSAAGVAGLTHTVGGAVGMDMEAYAHSKLILIWGSNSITSNLHFWRIAQQARRNGATLVAIDPWASETARKCDRHLAPMPGTDAALALAMMHVLITEDLVDHDYIARYTQGFDELRERALQYPPARAAAICGLDEADIVWLAREYGRTRPAAIRLNYGLQRTRGGGNAVRAIMCLPALTGAWRDAGGGALLSSSGHYPVDMAGLTRPDLLPSWPRLPRVVNMVEIGDALAQADPPIEALVVYNANPVAVAPDSEKVIRGFAREDLFTVVLEHFLTDTADHADWVLPATTQLEHFDLHKTYGHRYVVANNPAVAPLGQALPNSEIFRRLAARMGFNDPCLQDSDQEIARAALNWRDPSLAGVSLDAILERGWAKLSLPQATFAQGGFPSRSGKVEFVSERLAARGQDPLPDFIAPYESAQSNPSLAARYPLALLSPPARNFLNSTFVNVDSNRTSHPEPACEIHPDDAAPRGIADGSRVRLFNDRGSFIARAVVTPNPRPGVVVAFGVWWHKLCDGRRNVNAVTGQALSDLGNAPTFYDCLVQVEPAPAQ